MCYLCYALAVIPTNYTIVGSVFKKNQLEKVWVLNAPLRDVS